MNENKPYSPVSCEMHSEFELLIMHNSKIDLSWHDAQGISHQTVVMPKDIHTKAGEEFLVVVDNNDEQLNIRLDRIQSFKKT